MKPNKNSNEQKERAVSPVIGVILMVAITVILAAVIGAFVLGLGDQVGNTAPSASFDYDYDSDGQNVTITHDGGDALDPDEINVTSGDESIDGTEFSSDSITAGDSATINVTGSGDTVRIIWQSDSGQSSTVGSYEVP